MAVKGQQEGFLLKGRVRRDGRLGGIGWLVGFDGKSTFWGEREDGSSEGYCYGLQF